MIKGVNRAISISFLILITFTPIILFPTTSEVFEFNKIIFTYLMTVIILALWLSKCIVQKQFIFRRTILDIPLILYLVSQLISTIFSIDPITSLFGYYSRFNGGLLSSLSYCLLYWAYISNINLRSSLIALKYLILSALVVATYGILEHFGIDKHLWVQDVANRVFSTLGQPNWLAAFLVATIPITWALEKQNKFINTAGYILSAIFFTTLLFTKSRSGLVGFAFADIAFWITSLLVLDAQNNPKKEIIRSAIVHHSIFIILILIIGSPWTPNLKNLAKMKYGTWGTENKTTSDNTQQGSTVLETGGTESGEIRKIVWKGAVDIWKAYPLYGSGVETFAYSYFKFRPAEHNLVSEWDFIYNKAHNEYLNYGATTGTLGLLSYLVLIGFSIFQMVKIFQFSISKNENSIPNKARSFFVGKNINCKLLITALCAGYIGILTSNFFGFSVVTISLLMFLYPAIAITLQEQKTNKPKSAKASIAQKSLLFLTLCIMLYALFNLARIWYADTLYAQGRELNKQKDYSQARLKLDYAVKISPLKQPVYLEEMAKSASGLALDAYSASDKDRTKTLAESAIDEINQAIKISANNIGLTKSRAGILVQLASIDPTLFTAVVTTLKAAIDLAPTDAKLYYNLGLSYLKLHDFGEAIKTLEKAVELKANYKDARYALAVLYNQNGQKDKARNQLEYILKNLAPNDLNIQKQLKAIN